MTISKRTLVISVLLVVAIGYLLLKYGRSYWGPIYIKFIRGKRTVDEVVEIYEKPVKQRLQKHFTEKAIAYPPQDLKFLAIKDKKLLEMWAKDDKGKWKLIKSYPILGLSGKLGPKLASGDLQVPEGCYRIIALNPNSSYHLSLKINYPNDKDQEIAVKEGRSNLGGNIFIHGKTNSIGCLAMGDPAIEEIFVIVAYLQPREIEIIIAPIDFRKKDVNLEDQRIWVQERYNKIRRRLLEFSN